MALDDARTVTPRDEPTASRPVSEPVPDAARLVGDERLPCGRMVSRVWEQARAATDPADYRMADSHMADCPFCRQAAEGLTALDTTTRALRTECPSAHTVADRVIRAVRAEVRLGRMLPLDDPARALRIAETPAAKVLRRAADRVNGVRAASCRLTPDDRGADVTIIMTLAMALDRPLPGRATEVRRAIAHAAWQQLGLPVGSIDLNIVSVLEPRGATASAEPPPRTGSGQ